MPISLESQARDFLANPINSYSRLSTYLNQVSPRPDGHSWTKDSAYHLCRSNGITSKRRCRSQPAAGITRRRSIRQSILDATLKSLSASSRPLCDLAPFQPSEIAHLSGFQRVTVLSNWNRLENELLALAGLPPRPTTIPMVEED